MRARISSGSRSGARGSPGAVAIRGRGPLSTGGSTAMRRMRRASRSLEWRLSRLPAPKLHAASNKQTAIIFTMEFSATHTRCGGGPQGKIAAPQRRAGPHPESTLLFRPADANPELAQLARLDRGGRVGEHVHGALAFGKRDHVAQRFGAAQKHREPVDAEGDAAVGRRAVAQRFEEKPELRLRLFRADAHEPEDFSS